MKKILLTVTLGLLFLTSCKTIKIIKLLRKGEITQSEFKAEIPFEYRLGLIVLKVNIKGKNFDFVLDTGAPNVISKELALELNLQPKISDTIEDGKNTKSNLDLVTLKNINIGGLDFINTAAVIADVKEYQEVGCLKIDGFIGSNLMRKAIWKFDYQNQIITITNSLDSLDISSYKETLPFYPELTGTPLCDIKINGVVEKDICIDLGSNGNITMSNDSYAKITKDHLVSEMISYGNTGSGLFGNGEIDTTVYIIVPEISFGNIFLTNQIIEFSEGSSTIGMEFFKNYNIIIDWSNKNILLEKFSDYKYTSITDFGFSWIFKDGKLLVGLIIAGSDAEGSLKLGDQILEINGENYSDISINEWCLLLEKSILSEETIDMTILRGSKKININLEEKILLK